MWLLADKRDSNDKDSKNNLEDEDDTQTRRNNSDALYCVTGIIVPLQDISPQRFKRNSIRL
jgi:hypothetical protein